MHSRLEMTIINILIYVKIFSLLTWIFILFYLFLDQDAKYPPCSIQSA